MYKYQRLYKGYKETYIVIMLKTDLNFHKTV